MRADKAKKKEEEPGRERLKRELIEQREAAIMAHQCAVSVHMVAQSKQRVVFALESRCPPRMQFLGN